VGVLDKLFGRRPPTSKEMGLTNEETFFSKRVKNYVNAMYYHHRQVREYDDGEYSAPWMLNQNDMEQRNSDRQEDPKYNDRNAPLQIHCFGDSWTYGWDLPQEKSFPHLLGDENTSVFNHGAGKTGLDYSIKKMTEVYQEFNHRENKNFVYVITIPHAFRRMNFEYHPTDKKIKYPVGRRTWSKERAIKENEYNHYLYFLHHYEIANRLLGRDKIIWGTWDEEIPKDMIDIFFDLVDFAPIREIDGMVESRVGNKPDHPGEESHRLYAEQIKNIMRKSGWYDESK